MHTKWNVLPRLAKDHIFTTLVSMAACMRLMHELSICDPEPSQTMDANASEQRKMMRSSHGALKYYQAHFHIAEYKVGGDMH
jgi:hypothetical protein